MSNIHDELNVALLTALKEPVDKPEITFYADDSIHSVAERARELHRRVMSHIEMILIKYLLLASPKLKIDRFTSDLHTKLKWRGIKLMRKEDSFLGGMHYTIWMEQRGKTLGMMIRVDYKDTGVCVVKLVPGE